MDELLQTLRNARSRAYNTPGFAVLDRAVMYASMVQSARLSIRVLLAQIETLGHMALPGHYSQLHGARAQLAEAKAHYRNMQEKYTLPDIEDLDSDEAQPESN